MEMMRGNEGDVCVRREEGSFGGMVWDILLYIMDKRI